MAGASLLALLDDIASILDDVSVLTKVAARKTAGVLGDDLALNAQQVSGVKAERELPVVWAVAKGSLLNKAILVPVALGLSYFAPWSVTPLLALGGAYLCFEGFEKVFHLLTHRKETGHKSVEATVARVMGCPESRRIAEETRKVKGAIRTDFILSAEIVIIALGTVSDQTFAVQAFVVSAIAVVMTMGVYGLVAGIVKLDDLGLYLSLSSGAPFKRGLGKGILWFAPFLMKCLSIAGTVAMFLVGGGILVHALPSGHEVTHGVEHFFESFPGIGYVLAALTGPLVNGVAGLVLGGILFLVASVFSKMRRGVSSLA